MAELGLRLTIVGDGGTIVKLAGEDVPPLVVTVTLTFPALANRPAETKAVSCVELPTVAESAVGPKFTVAGPVKFVPVTVKVKAGPPAVAELGFKLVIVGNGGAMGKLTAPDVPPEVVTVTFTFPALAIRVAGTRAVSCVVLFTVALRAFAPKFTVAGAVKLLPVTVSVKAAPPTVAEFGFKLVMDGVDC